MLWLPFWIRRILIFLILPLPIQDKYKDNLGTVEDYFWYYARKLAKTYRPQDYIGNWQKRRNDKGGMSPILSAQKHSSIFRDSDATFFQRLIHWVVTLGGVATALDYLYKAYLFVLPIIKGIQCLH